MARACVCVSAVGRQTQQTDEEQRWGGKDLERERNMSASQCSSISRVLTWSTDSQSVSCFYSQHNTQVAIRSVSQSVSQYSLQLQNFHCCPVWECWCSAEPRMSCSPGPEWHCHVHNNNEDMKKEWIQESIIKSDLVHLFGSISAVMDVTLFDGWLFLWQHFRYSIINHH